MKNDITRITKYMAWKKCEDSPVAHVTIVLFQGFVPVLGGGKTNVSGATGPTGPVLSEQGSVLAHTQSWRSIRKSVLRIRTGLNASLESGNMPPCGSRSGNRYGTVNLIICGSECAFLPYNSYLCSMIYTAPCTMFWMRAYPLLGQVRGGWALDIESFLGPLKWHRADRQVPFGAQKTRDFQGPTPSHLPK